MYKKIQNYLSKRPANVFVELTVHVQTDDIDGL